MYSIGDILKYTEKEELNLIIEIKEILFEVNSFFPTHYKVKVLSYWDLEWINRNLGLLITYPLSDLEEGWEYNDPKTKIKNTIRRIENRHKYAN